MKPTLASLCALGATLMMACSQHVTTESRSPQSYVHPTSSKYNYYFLEALRLQNKGDFPAAFDLLTQCVALDSLAPEAYYMLGVYYADIGDDSIADAYLKRAIELNPRNDAYHERLAQWYLQTQNYPGAIAAYEHLYANNHERTDVLEILLRLYQQTQNYDQMLHTLARYEQVEGISEETTLTKMQIYQQKGEEHNAYKALKTLCDEHPNDVNCMVLLANWLSQHHRIDEARTIFATAEQTDPNNEFVTLSLYDFYRAEGEDSLSNIYRDKLLLNRHTATGTKLTMLQYIIRDNEERGEDSTKVITLLDTILSVDSMDLDVAELKASYMLMKGMDTTLVNQAWRQVLGIAPDHLNARLQLLQSQVRTENLPGIIAVCEPALIYNPDELTFCYYLGLAHYQLSDTLAALSAFRHGLSRIPTSSTAASSPDLVSDFYAIVGDIEHSLHNDSATYAAYDSCLQWKPDNAACLNNYAYFLAVDNRELRRAETMSLRAITLEPNNPTYLDTYAWVLFRLERFTEAQQYIDRTLSLSDSITDATLLDHAGDIYEAIGEATRAVEFWKEALMLEPEDSALIRKKLLKYEK